MKNYIIHGIKPSRGRLIHNGIVPLINLVSLKNTKNYLQHDTDVDQESFMINYIKYCY